MRPESARLRPLVARWAETWGVAGLEERIEIQFSRRFRASLGRCIPARGEIRLAAFLLEGPAELLHEAVCHEAAHAAVYALHGRRPRPHGGEWRSLMQAAGFKPRARIPAELLPEVVRQRGSGPWEHRCPVCHATRMARRPIYRWRCAHCLEAGRDGEIVVTRVGGAVR